MKTIVSVSGGLGSAYALHKAIEQHGRENVIALFADVKGTGSSHFWSDLSTVENLLHERFGGETADTYRFVWQIASALDVPIERLEDGRSIWAVFAQARAFRLVVRNRFFCKASDWLKREVIASWIEQRFKSGEWRLALGMGWDESRRIESARGWWTKRMGYPVEVYSPIANPRIDSCVMSDWLNSIRVEPPAAYAAGFPHNNCGGVCVQAGQGQYAQVYKNDPERYHYAAWQESRLQRIVGINATILKIERNGVARSMSLYEFADRVGRGDYDRREWGGCSCFVNADMTRFLAQAIMPDEAE